MQGEKLEKEKGSVSEEEINRFTAEVTAEFILLIQTYERFNKNLEELVEKIK